MNRASVQAHINSLEDTLPVRPHRVPNRIQPIQVPHRRGTARMGCCSCTLAGLLLPLILVSVYFLAPLHTNFLVLGIDRTPDGTALGRSDIIILTSIVPVWQKMALLSIPRDLWVTIPGVGENRINTAHFFAEAEQAGSGPAAAAEAVEANFSVPVPYYAQVRFDAFLLIVNALGGVTINLPSDMGGLSAGSHHLDGQQALAFVRDRQGTDDFYRMEHTQLMIKAIALQMLLPGTWSRLPDVLAAGFYSIDTNLPIRLWPRLVLDLLRASISGFDSHTIGRDMVTPFTTEGGAAVLLPNWELINPMVQDLFGN